MTVSPSPNLAPAPATATANATATAPNPSSLLPSSGVHNTSPFLAPSGLPPTPGPPGLVPLPMLARPISNPGAHQQTFHTYPSLPAMASSPQPLWLQPPYIGGGGGAGMPRPPFLSHPSQFTGPFPMAAQGIPRPSFPLLDSQPPGVVPTVPCVANRPSSASGHQLAGASGMETELPPPGIDNRSDHEIGTKDNPTTTEPLDTWTAHKTETGIVYYYNAVTGVSTYEKPSVFTGEPEQITVRSIPVSVENLAGTEWALVTTNDGKRYYYNSKTKLTSWQIPSEVTEFRKKQEVDVLKEDIMPMIHANVLTEKGSAPVTLSAPAINTGGRDAATLRPTSVLGASSALDLIKRKLQDAGAPVTSSPGPTSLGTTTLESNGSRAIEDTTKGLLSENSKDKPKDANGDGNISDSSTDSEDEDNGPSKEECIIKFKEMLKERGVAPFSKWEKELPKIVFDPRFKAIPSHSARRSLFEYYVKTRAEEERKEKRAAQKAAIEGFKQLLEEAAEDIDHNMDYQTFRKKWGNDPRFEALDRKDREHLLNERILPLKKAVQEKAEADRAVVAASFKSMLREKSDINVNSRWLRVKDSLRNDPRYKSVKHEDREVLFSEYLSELKAAEEEAGRSAKAKRDEELASVSAHEKLKERERETRKRKEREEQEMQRVRLKVRRKEAVASFQALLVETIKDSQASWTDSKPKLEKDPQRRASNPELDPSEAEKLFREHIKMLHERCMRDFKALLDEVVTSEAAATKTDDGKTVLDSWSTAKRLLKPDPRYSKVPRKERETSWRRHSEEILRREKSALDQENKYADGRSKSSIDSGRHLSGSRRAHDRK